MNEKWENLHNQAMELSDSADQFRRDKDQASARDLYRHAMEKEREAALGYRDEPDAKPATTAILLRSAATLALEAGEWREAEKLVGLALFGDAPPAIADELRDLSEQLYFQRHLELRNVTISEQEIQLSLSGNGVSFGMVQSDDFLDRGEALQDLLYRAAERLSDQPYRRSGGIAPALREQFAVFVSAPRASSFAVTYRIGTPEEVLMTDALRPDPNAILDEVVTNLRLFDEQNERALEDRLGGDYLKNFLAQAKRLAPDGKRITQVGLTTRRAGKIEPLALRRVVPRQPRQREVPTVTHEGTISKIEDRKKTGSVLVSLEANNGGRINIVALDAATVVPYFQKKVRLTVRKQKGEFVIQEINAV
jgi:hypothetical protein